MSKINYLFIVFFFNSCISKDSNKINTVSREDVLMLVNKNINNINNRIGDGPRKWGSKNTGLLKQLAFWENIRERILIHEVRIKNPQRRTIDKFCFTCYIDNTLYLYRTINTGKTFEKFNISKSSNDEIKKLESGYENIDDYIA